MTIDLSKILAMSSGDYLCYTHSHFKHGYNFVGVHYEEHMGRNVLLKFSELVPETAEVVTDFKVVFHPGFQVIASGTALIPRVRGEQ